MKLDYGNVTLQINLQPFQLVFTRDEQTLLRSAQVHQPASTYQTDFGARVEFTHGVLNINLTEQGFEIQSPGDYELAFEMSGHWFGHGELLNQRLPLDRLMIPLSPFETFDNGPAGQSCKLTPAWYSSNGVLIMAESPLQVGINQPPEGYPRYHWSLGSDKGPFAHRPFDYVDGQGDGLLTFKGENGILSLSFGDDAIEAYQKLLTRVGHPVSIPPVELFRLPTWTTWARYKTEVNQDVVLKFAEEIRLHGYPYGVMEIDDRWQVHYGDISFDPARFPDPKAMVDCLHEMGFKVTMWVIPFLDKESAAFREGSDRGYLVRQQDGSPYQVPWWQGWGGLLDATNPKAMEWFYDRLRVLQAEYGIDGFKFDAGEACFMPKDGHTFESIHPNQYANRYVDFIGKHFDLTEVRSAWFNHRSPIFMRQWDKATSWGADNGLHSVLTGMLALGTTGYPFILPDMVGGNAYENQADAELMIRWTQLNALLPAIQFSLAPWDYGEECVSICRKYADLHTKFAETFVTLAEEAARSGAPIVRPLWWLDAQDESLLLCDDQFLLGNDILVAPVLAADARARDVILPPGTWKDYWSGEEFEGGQVLKNYPTPLDVLPVFERK